MLEYNRAIQDDGLDASGGGLGPQDMVEECTSLAAALEGVSGRFNSCMVAGPLKGSRGVLFQCFFVRRASRATAIY
jgi:hypothetical protein